MITVIREPDGETLEVHDVKSVKSLLNRLGERCTSVLVIRGRELLTEDRKLVPGETLVVRSVRSRG
ncbi:hypothetical protein dsx2_0958 [Desulfovibrio sp. X2]|uniref:hypothetical protein n=1 Tax=Desulfovibrio sp. X2 TaxID=941449 RepID=UPI000358B453|nr:hypothetical protein [Desulfovibrio sp. X2]EPR37015.1 hypothetical protein dsx2_0958 [Desulfovibrio sp. X2]